MIVAQWIACLVKLQFAAIDLETGKAIAATTAVATITSDTPWGATLNHVEENTNNIDSEQII